MNRKYSTLQERLIANSYRNDRFIFDGTPCWDWLGAFGTGGGGENRRYPTLCIRVNGKVKTFRAHRVSYEEFTGDKLGEREAGHRCHRSCCISPLHLEPVTSQENHYQRDAKRNGALEGAREFEPLADRLAPLEDSAVLPTEENVMNKAPWPDFNGYDIYEGDIIAHPSGETGQVVFLASESDPSDQWRVNYGTDYLSRLCLQIGDKGRAIVTPNKNFDPPETPE